MSEGLDLTSPDAVELHVLMQHPIVIEKYRLVLADVREKSHTTGPANWKPEAHVWLEKLPGWKLRIFAEVTVDRERYVSELPITEEELARG